MEELAPSSLTVGRGTGAGAAREELGRARSARRERESVMDVRIVCAWLVSGLKGFSVKLQCVM